MRFLLNLKCLRFCLREMGPGRDSESRKRKQANRSEILKFEFRDVFGRAMCKIIGNTGGKCV